MKHLDLTVTDLSGLNAMRPVTGGVPLAQGAAPRGVRFGLMDADGSAAPLDTTVSARWPDGSARWVLLDFQAQPPPRGIAQFRLTWSRPRKAALPPPVAHPVRVTRGNTVTLHNGKITVAAQPGHPVRLNDRVELRLLLTAANGRHAEGFIESAGVEKQGALRATMAVAGAFHRADGSRLFGFQIRISAYAGQTVLAVEPRVLMDAGTGVIQRFRALDLELRTARTLRSAALGGRPGWRGKPRPIRQFQIDDRHYRIEGADREGKQAPGWAEFDDGQGRISVCLRDFWQQWPKAIEIRDDGIRLGLFPRFERGAFSHMAPRYKYDFLFHNSCYQMRTGQTRSWEIAVDSGAGGPSLRTSISAPLVPAADPQQAVDTGAWGDIAPAGAPGMAAYDRWAAGLFEHYQKFIRRQRDYGAMNWGDWFGERGANWGNHEYDLVHQLLILFARTADPRYYHAAATAARHSSDVDVIQFVNDDLRQFITDNWPCPTYPPRPGMVHEHCVGHVSGFYSIEYVRRLYVKLGVGEGNKRPWLCLSPHDLGHVWTQGLARQYLLSGDPWLQTTVFRIGDNLAQLATDREFAFTGGSHHGRVAGWTLLALSGAFEVKPKQQYRRAMRLIVDDCLAEQDPCCGGWLFELGPGHCRCTKRRHVGECGFITAIRLNGLVRYYQLTGDRRIPAVVCKALTNLNRDAFCEEWHDWRYSSCPASQPSVRPGDMLLAMTHGYRLSHDAGLLPVIMDVWNAKFEATRNLTEHIKTRGALQGFGKICAQHALGSAETATLVAESMHPGRG